MIPRDAQKAQKDAAPSAGPELDPHFLMAHRKRVVGSVVAIVLLGTIGVLLWFNFNKVNPEEIRRHLQASIDEVNAIPAEKVIERDDRARSILDNEEFARYGGEVLSAFRREQQAWHARALAEKGARDKVRPFLDRWDALKASPDGAREEMERLLDEGKSLRQQFGSTSFAPRLEEAVAAMEKALGSGSADTWAAEFITLKQECDRAAAGSDFAGAFASMEKFAAAHQKTKDLEAKLAELKDSLTRKGEARIEALIREAERLLGKGDRAEAATLIRGAAPGLKGLSSAWKVEKYIQDQR